MPAQMLNVIPVLPARDVEEAIAFYRDRLGFEYMLRDAEPARYAGLRRGAVTLHLYMSEDRYLAENASLRISVDDVDALYAQCQAAGCVHPNGALGLQPWGARVFGDRPVGGIAFVQAQT